MKKILSLVLALVMVLASCAVAFAADPSYSITVTNDNTSVSINGKTYYAYKLFDMTYSGSNPDDPHTYSIKSSDWAWDHVKGTIGEGSVYTNSTYGLKFTPTADDPSLYMIESSMDATKARKLADDLKAYLPSASGSAVAANEKATISLDDAGYYLVYGTATSTDGAAKEVTAALSLTSTDPTGEVKPKVEVPPLDKKITGEHVLDSAGKAATAEVGKTVSFELDSTVPDLTGYSDYTYIIKDTMSSGLTFNDDIVVKINGETIAAEKYTKKLNDGGFTFTLQIPYATLIAATKGQAIVVTYSATVNDTALTTDYEKNTAKLTYSNNPYDTTTNDTPEKTVFVIDVDINVDKVANEADGNKLKDAKFKVFKGATTPADDANAWYKWDSTNKKVTWVTKAEADAFTTGEDGKFTPSVKGLEAEKTGTKYGLLEIEAPKGYNLLPDPVIITLTGSLDGKTATITADGAAMTNGTINLENTPSDKQPLATAQVINKSGTELPSTGGIGTTIFYIVGGILLVGAAIILVSRRRAHN